MSEEPRDQDELSAIQMGLPGRGFQADMALPAISLKDIIDEVAPSGVKVDAKECLDQPFKILRAKPFLSRFEGQHHAYYVVGADVKTGELFNTTLGGAAVVDLLDAWTSARRSEPLIVTLGWVEGGRFGGYYTLE